MDAVGKPSYGLMDVQPAEQKASRVPLPHWFKPGQSGNPSGRPKNADHVVVLARQRTAAAIHALEAALEVPSTRVAAAAVLLDRGWGKPTQHLEHTGADGGPIQTQELPPDTRMTIDAFIAEWREVPAGDGE